MTVNLTFADFYAGIGGFRIGLEQNGWHCVFTNEADPYCITTYNANFHESYQAARIEDINPKFIPDFQVFCGGFPCQPFSIAGKKKGFQDERGKAIKEIIRICKIKKPKVILLENVSHITRLEKGFILKEIKDELSQIGYSYFDQILDSKYFQVPQSRPRWFLVAFRLDLGIKDFKFPKLNLKYACVDQIIEPEDYSIPISAKWHQYIDYYAGRLKASELSFPLPKTRVKIERSDPDVDYDNCIYQMRSSGIRAISINRPFPTFAVSVSGGGAMIPVYSKERRHLSLVEIKRIMGFPDNFLFPISRTCAIKQFSNAVCPPVIKSLGKEISNILT